MALISWVPELYHLMRCARIRERGFC